MSPRLVSGEVRALSEPKKVVGVYERPHGSKRSLAVGIAIAVVIILAVIVYLLSQ